MPMNQIPNIPAMESASHDSDRDVDTLLSRDDEPPQHGKSSWLCASFNFINSIVGAGVFGLPYAVSRTGFWSGMVLILLVAFLTHYGVNLILEAGLKLKVTSYQQLCEHCFGRNGKKLISVFMFLYSFGATCAYMIIIGDTLPRFFSLVFPGANFLTRRELVILVAGVVLVLPLCLMREMSSLERFSVASFCAHLLIIGTLLLTGPATAVAQGISFATEASPLAVVQPQVFSGIGAFAFAFICHHNSFMIFASLESQTVASWHKVSLFSIAVAAVVSLGTALGGYLLFFSHIKSDILNNFPDDSIPAAAMRLLLGLSMSMTHPMENFVARHALHTLLDPAAVPGAMTHRQHYLLAGGLWLLSVVVAMSTANLGAVLELTGSLSASMLGFIVPAVIFFRLRGVQASWTAAGRSWREEAGVVRKLGGIASDFALPAFMLVFGALVCTVGSVGAFM